MCWNHIIWAKPSGRWNGCNKESLRAYFSGNRAHSVCRTLYRDRIARKDDGYVAQGRELKQHVMAPLISYFRDARKSLGIIVKTDSGSHRKEKHGFALVWRQPVAVTERG